jgi:hypothetical protein
MISKQERGDPGTPALHHSLGWLTGVAVAALALIGVAAGSRQPAPATTSAAIERPASDAILVSPIDHSVVQAIDATGEPDSTGASIAAYGP